MRRRLGQLQIQQQRGPRLLFRQPLSRNDAVEDAKNTKEKGSAGFQPAASGILPDAGLTNHDLTQIATGALRPARKSITAPRFTLPIIWPPSGLSFLCVSQRICVGLSHPLES
jgi:hypothetical protein